jgi:hypothetical protein
MSNIHRIGTSSVLVLGLALVPAGAPAQDEHGFRIDFTVGGQYADFDTTSAKAEEYRDLSDGFLLEQLRLGLFGPASAWSMELTGNHLARRDQELSLGIARTGSFRLDLEHVRTPHLLYRDAATVFTGSKGDYLVSDTVRSALESLVTPSASTADAVRAVLDGVSRDKDLAIQRDRTQIGLGFGLAAFWDARVSAAREKRSGNDRVSNGTYIRRQAVSSDPTSGPGFFDRERVEVRGIELPKPIDAEIDEAGLGSTIHGGSWLVDFGWEASSYDNDRAALRWENPFEGGTGAASSSGGLDPAFDQEPASPIGNTGNRGRYVRAELALEPDNDYERAFLSGAVTLPRRTRINLSYSAATTQQDQAFLGYTLNPEILFSNGPDGVAGTADDARAIDVAPAAHDLDGKVDTTRLDVRISSRPIDGLSLRAKFAEYEYDDRSAAISWPGYAAAGDSYFRRNVGKRDADGNKILINEVADYSRSVWSVGGGWRFGHFADVELDYANTEWEYEARQVESNEEDSLAAVLRLRPTDAVSVRLSYLDASREIAGAYVTGLETSRVRAFDVWDRDRTRYGAEVELLVGDHATLSLAYDDWTDEYPGVVDAAPTTSNPFPSLPYGLNEASTETISATLTWAEESWTLSGSLGSDDSSWESLMVSKTSLTGDTIQFDPANRWRRTQSDEVIWASIDLRAELAESWNLEASLFYQDYDGATESVNLAAPTINSGVATPFSGQGSELLSSELELTWDFSDRLGFGLRYLYEPYRLDDFAWDGVEPYMQGNLEELGDSATDVRDMNAYRLLWMDATYSDYTAHVFRLFARLRF